MLRESWAKISQHKRGPNCLFSEYSPSPYNAPVLCINSIAPATFFSPQPFLGQAQTPGRIQKYPQYQSGCFIFSEAHLCRLHGPQKSTGAARHLTTWGYEIRLICRFLGMVMAICFSTHMLVMFNLGNTVFQTHNPINQSDLRTVHVKATRCHITSRVHPSSNLPENQIKALHSHDAITVIRHESWRWYAIRFKSLRLLCWNYGWQLLEWDEQAYSCGFPGLYSISGSIKTEIRFACVSFVSLIPHVI